MSDKQHSHVPYGADGSGYYTENAQGCFICIKEASSLVMEALGIFIMKWMDSTVREKGNKFPK